MPHGLDVCHAQLTWRRRRQQRVRHGTHHLLHHPSELPEGPRGQRDEDKRWMLCPTNDRMQQALGYARRQRFGALRFVAPVSRIRGEHNDLQSDGSARLGYRQRTVANPGCTVHKLASRRRSRCDSHIFEYWQLTRCVTREQRVRANDAAHSIIQEVCSAGRGGSISSSPFDVVTRDDEPGGGYSQSEGIITSRR